jgi:dUTP pyrophosphatase
MTINVKKNSGVKLPEYKHPNDAGADISAFLEEDIIIPPNGTKLIPTGLFIEIPESFEGQIRSRSGLALKSQIVVLNSPATIDSGYVGEWGVILHNFGEREFVVKNGDRIAQMVISPVAHAEFKEVEKIGTTERGEGGYGSTGI